LIRGFLRHGAQILPHGALGHLGWLRGALGGAIGIACAGLLGRLMLGATSPALPLLAAPIGASAVLVFAVPASPLAQPWAVIGGNLISATVGLVAGHMIGAPLPATAVAVGLAIAAMSLARCLHPPGGACALLYALGATGAEHWGPAHLATIGLNVLALGLVGWLFNNLTGHPWPHRPVKTPDAAAPDTRSTQFRAALTSVLADWNEVVDADVDDLDAIFQAVERRIQSGVSGSGAKGG
jgi:CBS domain-containing membrane protein